MEPERPKKRGRGRMRERRYESRGHAVVVREGDDAVELEIDGVPIDAALIDGEYHSQTAHPFRSFPSIDAVVDELLGNEGRTWSLHGGLPQPGGHDMPGMPDMPHDHGHGSGGNT
jgi:hypothetical protein